MAIGDRMFWGCKNLILPLSNQICRNLTTFAQSLPQFCSNLINFNKIFASQGMRLHSLLPLMALTALATRLRNSCQDFGEYKIIKMNYDVFVFKSELINL